MEGEVSAMETILAAVTSIFTEAMTWAGTVATTVTDEPLYLLFTVLGLVGLGIGFFKRLTT